MTKLAWLAFVLVSMPALAGSYANDITQYGKDCAKEIGVPVPPVDCTDPNGTELKVQVNGKEVEGAFTKCDRPALLEPAKACVSGGRLIKYTQRFTRKGGGEETVTTMVLCRRARTYAKGSNQFDDIGVIQYNETNHKTCWFYTVRAGIRAGGADPIPPPWAASYDGPAGKKGSAAARGFWASPDSTLETRCVRCHNTGPWLRTPYVNQAKTDGPRNAIPENPTHATTSVGAYFKSWNDPKTRAVAFEVDERKFRDYIQKTSRRNSRTGSRAMRKDAPPGRRPWPRPTPARAATAFR